MDKLPRGSTQKEVQKWGPFSDPPKNMVCGCESRKTGCESRVEIILWRVRVYTHPMLCGSVATLAIAATTRPQTQIPQENWATEWRVWPPKKEDGSEVTYTPASSRSSSHAFAA